MSTWFFRCALAVAALPALAQSSVPGLVVASGYDWQPPTLWFAPGQLATIYVHGIGASLPDALQAEGLPLPETLGGISIELVQTSRLSPLPVPIFRLERRPACATQDCARITAITFHMPYELRVIRPNEMGLVDNPYLVVSENGVRAAVLPFGGATAQVHILAGNDSIARSSGPSPATGALVRRLDGTLVTRANPAKPGEILVLWAVGLGVYWIDPPKAGYPSPAGFAAYVGIGFEFGASPAPRKVNWEMETGSPGPPPVDGLLYAGLAPGLVGIYQINFQVPATVPPGTPPCDPLITHNLSVNIGYPLWFGYTFDGAGICVAVP